MSYILQIQMSYHYRRVFLNNLHDFNCIIEITKATWEQHNCISIKIYWDISITKMRSSNILYSSYLVNNKHGVKLMFIYLYPINILYTIISDLNGKSMIIQESSVHCPHTTQGSSVNIPSIIPFKALTLETTSSKPAQCWFTIL